MPADAGKDELEDPRGHEGAPPVSVDAPVESSPADPFLSGDGGADRPPISAAGAPAEPTSDDDRPGQSPDAAPEVPKARPPRDGLAPGEVPAVTATSSPAAEDVPVVEEAVGRERVTGDEDEREGIEVPATTGGDDPGATTSEQPGAETPPAPADVADVRPTDAETTDGSPVPADSSAVAVTSTEAADEIAARGDVADPASAAAQAPAPESEAPAAGDAPAEAPAPAGDAPAEADAPAAAAPEPEGVVVVDEERQPLLDLLAEHLGDGLVATHVVPGRDMTIRVTREAWVKVAEVCRDVLGMRSFSFLSAMDWMPSPYGRSEGGGLAGVDVDIANVAADPSTFEAGTTGGETRFQVLARLQTPVAPSIGITIKCDVPMDDLVVPTWSKVFPGADWHERECAEMFGIDFAGHPNLVKLYLPGEFEGYPLRKDFPLLAREVKPWPGLVDVEAMPGEEASTDDDASVTAGAEEG